MKKDRLILITGASQGIGRALCKELVKNNYNVIGISRSTNKLENLQKELSSPLFKFYTADVGRLEDVKKIRTELENRGLIPDTIICAAAICEDDNKIEYNAQSMRNTIETNFFGTMNFIEVFSPIFHKKKSGHFISLSSLSAFKPNTRSVSYSTSKTAVSMAFRGFNMLKTPINFSTIYLGPVNTSMWEGKRSFIVVSPEYIAKKILKVIITPQKVSYTPFLSTTLSRLSLLIPDYIYARLSSYLFK